MSECSLISQPVIPLSASGAASKPLCPCMLGTIWAWTDNLRVIFIKSLHLLETTAQRYAKLEHLCFTW